MLTTECDFLNQLFFPFLYINTQILQLNFFQLPTIAALLLNLQLHPQVSKNVFMYFYHSIPQLTQNLVFAQSFINFQLNISV